MEQQIRILFLHDRLSARGGADRYLIGLLDHLSPQYKSLLAVGQNDGSLPEPEKQLLGPWQRVSGLARRGRACKAHISATIQPTPVQPVVTLRVSTAQRRGWSYASATAKGAR